MIGRVISQASGEPSGAAAREAAEEQREQEEEAGGGEAVRLSVYLSLCGGRVLLLTCYPTTPPGPGAGPCLRFPRL